MSVLLTQTEAAAPKLRSWADFRLIPRIETWPAVVSFVQTAPGKVILLAVFGCAIRFFLAGLVPAASLTFFYGILTHLPEYRRFVLAFVPVFYAVLPDIHDPLRILATLSVIALGMILYWCVLRWPQSAFG